MPDPLAPLTESRLSPFYQEHHRAWRDTLRRFVEAEIMPHVDQWDEAGTFPRELYRKASEVGLLRLGWPEEYGGVPSDPFMSIITSQEMARQRFRTHQGVFQVDPKEIDRIAQRIGCMGVG